jgi:hypothetical protein
MNQEILLKLKKLLTLSNSATTAEAENAMEKAIAIAAKHNIDLSSVSISAPEKEEFIETEYLEGKRKCVAQSFISKIITSHFNVKLIYSGNRVLGQRILFLGRKSDVEFAVYVQEFLKTHMMNAWKYYQKSKMADTRERATFFMGFYRGLDGKLTVAKKNQEQNSFGEINESIRSNAVHKYELMIQSEVEARENFVSKKHPTLKYGKAKRFINYGGSAEQAGFASGSTTNIFRPIGGGLCLT